MIPVDSSRAILCPTVPAATPSSRPMARVDSRPFRCRAVRIARSSSSSFAAAESSDKSDSVTVPLLCRRSVCNDLGASRRGGGYNADPYHADLFVQSPDDVVDSIAIGVEFDVRPTSLERQRHDVACLAVEDGQDTMERVRATVQLKGNGSD